MVCDTALSVRPNRPGSGRYSIYSFVTILPFVESRLPVSNAQTSFLVTLCRMCQTFATAPRFIICLIYVHINIICISTSILAFHQSARLSRKSIRLMASFGKTHCNFHFVQKVFTRYFRKSLK